jgi:hypothetical protein
VIGFASDINLRFIYLAMKHSPACLGAFFLALVFGLVVSTFAQNIPMSAGSNYISDIRPPAHPESQSQQPLEVENNAGIWKARRSTEKQVVTEPSKPVELKKTKFGADVTEPTGVFKGSLLDSEVDVANLRQSLARQTADTRKADHDAKVSVSPSPVPGAKEKEKELVPAIDRSAAPAQNIGLSLETSASAAPSVKPRP